MKERRFAGFTYYESVNIPPQPTFHVSHIRLAKLGLVASATSRWLGVIDYPVGQIVLPS